MPAIHPSAPRGWRLGFTHRKRHVQEKKRASAFGIQNLKVTDIHSFAQRLFGVLVFSPQFLFTKIHSYPGMMDGMEFIFQKLNTALKPGSSIIILYLLTATSTFALGGSPSIPIVSNSTLPALSPNLTRLFPSLLNSLDGLNSSAFAPYLTLPHDTVAVCDGHAPVIPLSPGSCLQAWQALGAGVQPKTYGDRDQGVFAVPLPARAISRKYAISSR